MFFILPVLAVVAETASVVTSSVIASVGIIGTTVAAGTSTIGVLAGTPAVTTIGVGMDTGIIATTFGIITSGGTTTVSNIGIVEAGKSIVTD